MKLAEISPLVGLGISWISEILRGTNAETGKKTNAKKRGRKPVDGLDNVQDARTGATGPSWFFRCICRFFFVVQVKIVKIVDKVFI